MSRNTFARIPKIKYRHIKSILNYTTTHQTPVNSCARKFPRKSNFSDNTHYKFSRHRILN